MFLKSNFCGRYLKYRLYNKDTATFCNVVIINCFIFRELVWRPSYFTMSGQRGSCYTAKPLECLIESMAESYL